MARLGMTTNSTFGDWPTAPPTATPSGLASGVDSPSPAPQLLPDPTLRFPLVPSAAGPDSLRQEPLPAPAPRPARASAEHRQIQQVPATHALRHHSCSDPHT